MRLVLPILLLPWLSGREALAVRAAFIAHDRDTLLAGLTDLVDRVQIDVDQSDGSGSTTLSLTGTLNSLLILLDRWRRGRLVTPVEWANDAGALLYRLILSTVLGCGSMSMKQLRVRGW